MGSFQIRFAMNNFCSRRDFLKHQAHVRFHELVQKMSWFPFRFAFPHTKKTYFISQKYLHAMENNLNGLQWLLLGIYIPSGVSKVIMPGPLKKIWPQLPAWFWPVCGLWEMLGTVLAVFSKDYYARVGFDMLYIFMGGVFSSILSIKDVNGHTLLHRKAPSGGFGAAFLVSATASVYLLTELDSFNQTISLPLALGVMITPNAKGREMV